jgi:hypothetical protein
MSIDLVSTHVEEIEKAFRGYLPPQCVGILIRMHEENRQLQTAVNDLQGIIHQVKEVAVLTVAQGKLIEQRFKRFEQRHSDPYADLAKTEERDS